jgi:hypothetical protein
MARFCLTLVAAAVTLSTTALLAHHSFGDFYIEEDTIEVEGQILEVQYKNPHSWILVQAEDPFRRQKVYSAEWASVSRLERDGITKRTLREGDWVRIWASPNRNPNDNRIRLKRIERRADHWTWGQNRGETR